MQRIYHTTNSLDNILKTNKLKSKHNLYGLNLSDIESKYNNLSSELAGYIKQYYKHIGKKIPNKPNDQIAYLNDYLLQDEKIHKELSKIINIKTKNELSKQSQDLDLLIRNSYVFFANDIQNSAHFAKNNFDKYTLSIKSDNIKTINYLIPWELVWWEVNINQDNLSEIYTTNPFKTEKLLKKYEYNNTSIRDLSFISKNTFDRHPKKIR